MQYVAGRRVTVLGKALQPGDAWPEVEKLHPRRVKILVEQRIMVPVPTAPGENPHTHLRDLKRRKPPERAAGITVSPVTGEPAGPRPFGSTAPKGKKERKPRAPRTPKAEAKPRAPRTPKKGENRPEKAAQKAAKPPKATRQRKPKAEAKGQPPEAPAAEREDTSLDV